MDLATQNHLHMLRDALLYRRNSLRAEVQAASLAHAQALDALELGDTKDLAALQQTEELDAAQGNRDLAELDATEAALLRLDAGIYGDCADCGEPIGLARLQLLPAAPRCAACQRLHEQAGARD